MKELQGVRSFVQKNERKKGVNMEEKILEKMQAALRVSSQSTNTKCIETQKCCL